AAAPWRGAGPHASVLPRPRSIRPTFRPAGETLADAPRNSAMTATAQSGRGRLVSTWWSPGSGGVRTPSAPRPTISSGTRAAAPWLASEGPALPERRLHLRQVLRLVLDDALDDPPHADRAQLLVLAGRLPLLGRERAEHGDQLAPARFERLDLL